MKPVNYQDINIESIIFDNPIYNKSDEIFQSSVKYSNDNRSDDFFIKTSRLRIVKIEQFGDVVKLTVEFLLSEPKFYESIKSIDNYTIKQVVDNSESWFGNKSKHETIENLFMKTIDLPNKLHNFPIMTLYLLNDCEIYDKLGDKVDVSSLKENNEIIANIQLKDIEFHVHKYNLIYLCKKININNYFCQVSHYLFNDSDELEDLDDKSNINSIEF